MRPSCPIRLSYVYSFCLFKGLLLYGVSAVFNPCGELFEAVDGVIVEGDPVLAEGAFMVRGEAAVFWTIRHAEVQVTAGEAVRIIWAFLLPK